MTRDEAAELVRTLGGIVQTDVSQTTDYVVTGDEPGSKLDRARRLGRKTIDEKRFLRLLRQAGAEV
jgi:DNA ligase (NAD+)